jgi:hypothetical protein
LRKVYPDLPPDPNDPMYEAFQAYGRAAAEQREKVESRRAQVIFDDSTGFNFLTSTDVNLETA